MVAARLIPWQTKLSGRQSQVVQKKKISFSYWKSKKRSSVHQAVAVMTTLREVHSAHLNMKSACNSYRSA
jgi:hypothetical protein